MCGLSSRTATKYIKEVIKILLSAMFEKPSRIMVCSSESYLCQKHEEILDGDSGGREEASPG